MNTRELNYVLAIYEERSISRAAERLYIAQPSLSKFLRNLEAGLGVQIFDRTTTPLTLTEFGEEYIRTARRMLLLQQDMMQRIRDMQDAVTGHLRIGMSLVRASCYLPKIFPAFHAKYPGIHIQLVEDSAVTLEEYLLQGKLDLIITSGMSEDSERIENQVIKQEKIYFATPTGFLPGREEQCFEQVVGEIPWEEVQCILLHKTQRVRKIADRVFRDYGLAPQILMETRVTDMGLKLCASGMGCTFVSEATREDPYYGKIQADYYLLEERYYLPVIVAVRKNAYLPQCAHRFLELLHSLEGL